MRVHPATKTVIVRRTKQWIKTKDSLLKDYFRGCIKRLAIFLSWEECVQWMEEEKINQLWGELEIALHCTLEVALQVAMHIALQVALSIILQVALQIMLQVAQHIVLQVVLTHTSGYAVN